MMVSERYPGPQPGPVVPAPGPDTGAGSPARQATEPGEGGEPACWAHLCVPKTLSTSCDQAVFVDQATDVSLSSDAVLIKVNRFG